MRLPERFMYYVYRCNSETNNNNDFLIASIIIRRVTGNEDLSIEAVADEANTSQASVSRYIRKMGFTGWQDFRDNCNGSTKEMLSKRRLQAEKLRGDKGKEEVAGKLCKNACDNIMATLKSFDVKKVDEIIDLLVNARKVFIIGDEHAQSNFYTFQLDLLFSGVPTYLYKNNEMQQLSSSFAGEGTAVLFLNVEKNFIAPPQVELLKNMRKNGAKLVAFYQQDEADLGIFDMTLKYGIPGSFNDGYYSLFVLAQIMSEYLISRG